MASEASAERSGEERGLERDDAPVGGAARGSGGEPVRVPGAWRLAEGEARKLLFPVPGREAPREVLLCRVGGRLFALDSECPHEGGRLQEGPLVDGRRALCPLHWFEFEPATGACVSADCPAAVTIRVEERDGAALLWLDQPARP